MARAAVYALLLAAAFVVAVLLLSGPTSRQRHGGSLTPTLFLHRRLGSEFRSAPTFDPLVATIEGHADEKKGPAPGQGPAADDESKHLGYEGRLNITQRLIVLFPMMDNAPQDGSVSHSELNSWLRDLAVDRLNHKTRKELTSRDKDGDSAVSFKEYLPQLSDEDIEKNDTSHGEAGWWKEQFVNADADRNGSLSFDEFKDFLHPEDSNNEEIKKWLVREKLERMDYDKDGKINYVEFSDHVYEIYKNYVEYETPGAHVPSAEESFSQLDVDKDKLLAVDELIPILNYLHPGELSYAKYYATYLMYEADDNKDGKLTLDEMLNNEYVFYSTVYDDDYDEDFHDEL